MMSIEQNSIIDDLVIIARCKVCGGEGTIEIFRQDLEEFEEIDCLHCKGN